eukprot:TRINITY_DN8120_c0_g1_i13.p1 TRINITY_DN8120_c0_g1~~TRINITY_DN8120_c0_g1_i13.p1  ORF type:complete len:145 (-),score=30.66 TRINITY_DN8120_c0_g1_i13:374-748(-)
MWDYYQHLSENPDTLLLRFYGSYALKPPHAHSIYIVVFQNVFNTSKNLHETYDLKGSWVNRGGGKEQVLNSSNKELKKTGLHHCTHLVGWRFKKDRIWISTRLSASAQPIPDNYSTFYKKIQSC